MLFVATSADDEDGNVITATANGANVNVSLVTFSVLAGFSPVISSTTLNVLPMLPFTVTILFTLLVFTSSIRCNAEESSSDTPEQRHHLIE